MKKKLEAELISIAHRILKIHNRQDIIQLQKEALNLYEKLSILRFYEENFEPKRPTIGKVELEQAIEAKPEITLEQTISIENVEEKSQTESKVNLPVKDLIENKDVIEINSQSNENAFETINKNNVDNSETTNSENQKAEQLEKSTFTEENNSDLEDVLVSYEELEANGLVENPSEPLSITVLEEIEDEIIIEKPKKEKKVKKTVTSITDEIIETEASISETTIEEITPVAEEVLEAKIPMDVPVQEPDLFNFTNDLFSGLDDTYSSATKNNNSIQSTFENLIGQTYQEPVFVKAEDLNNSIEEIKEEKTKKAKREKKSKDVIETSIVDDAFSTLKANTEGKSVSEMFNNSITLGLNDRIAFQMHLFNDSDKDLNRVVSQLNTMNNITEALNFINQMVKPDYNNWKGKEEFENRFMALVEKRFS